MKNYVQEFFRKSPRPVVAIDPDCEKSGYAEFDGKTIVAESLPFPLLIARARQYALIHPDVRIFVEAGWLNQSHWHIKPGTSVAMAASIGNSVGRNHETGRKIIEMLRFFNLDVSEVKPLKKFWSGQDRKISLDELNRQLVLRKVAPIKRCSQDARDAALIAIAYHG